MKYTRDWLIQQTEENSRLKYLFFWGDKARKDGTISASCLSQWWAEHPFEVEGKRYLTAEHYMMAGKAHLFRDEEIFAQILTASSPGAAKELGRKVRNFDQASWLEHRCAIVIAGNYAKFAQHPELENYLLQTGERILVEASPLDHIWGIGMDRHDPGAAHPAQWKGSNLLGFCLMEVRDQLRSGTSS